MNKRELRSHKVSHRCNKVAYSSLLSSYSNTGYTNFAPDYDNVSCVNIHHYINESQDLSQHRHYVTVRLIICQLTCKNECFPCCNRSRAGHRYRTWLVTHNSVHGSNIHALLVHSLPGVKVFGFHILPTITRENNDKSYKYIVRIEMYCSVQMIHNL